jgi:hypothetical protein
MSCKKLIAPRAGCETLVSSRAIAFNLDKIGAIVRCPNQVNINLSESWLRLSMLMVSGLDHNQASISVAASVAICNPSFMV